MAVGMEEEESSEILSVAGKVGGMAEALGKEQGYRSVEYLGGDKFRVDYALSGTLDRGFVYPINLDAMAFVPWIAAEVRKDGTVRIKAPGFGDPSEQMGKKQ